MLTNTGENVSFAHKNISQNVTDVGYIMLPFTSSGVSISKSANIIAAITPMAVFICFFNMVRLLFYTSVSLFVEEYTMKSMSTFSFF